jgi:hypothetical protein
VPLRRPSPYHPARHPTFIETLRLLGSVPFYLLASVATTAGPHLLLSPVRGNNKTLWKDSSLRHHVCNFFSISPYLRQCSRKAWRAVYSTDAVCDAHKAISWNIKIRRCVAFPSCHNGLNGRSDVRRIPIYPCRDTWLEYVACDAIDH